MPCGIEKCKVVAEKTANDFRGYFFAAPCSESTDDDDDVMRVNNE